jgi:hypothetical protein
LFSGKGAKDLVIFAPFNQLCGVAQAFAFLAMPLKAAANAKLEKVGRWLYGSKTRARTSGIGLVFEGIGNMEPSEIRYARSGSTHIAYQVVGDGPFDVVYVPGWVSHVELC